MRLSIALLAAALLRPAAPALGLTAEELAAKNIAARGGAARIDAIKSLRETGRLLFGFGDAQIPTEWGLVQSRRA